MLFEAEEHVETIEEEPEETQGWRSWFQCGSGSRAMGAVPQLNLETCMRAFCAPETLTADERITCDACEKLNEVEKAVTVSRLPEVLCLHIKRFRFTERGQSNKLHEVVHFPSQDLDFAPFCSPDALSSVESSKYNLAGIVTHTGDCEGGHYIAHARNYIDNRWYQFDDAVTRKISSESQVTKSEAYLLFYVRDSSMKQRERAEILRTLSPSKGVKEEMYLLCREWFTRYRAMDDVGRIKHQKHICKHGRLKHRTMSAMHQLFLWVPKSVWEALEKKYQGGPPLPASECLGPCHICEQQLMEDEERRRNEKKAIAEADTTTINNDLGYWYIIDAGWLRRWRQYTAEGSTSPPPGPVSNEVLLGPDGTPRKGLRKVDHYRGVNEQVWTIFQDYHGGGPEIRRREINLDGPDVSQEEPRVKTTGQMA